MRKKDPNMVKKITQKALKVFVQKGFFETTVEDIARAAGVAKGTIYLYFKDKPSIYTKTIDHHLAFALNEVAEIEMTEISAKNKLIKIANYFFNHMQHFNSLFPAVSFENISLAGKILKDLKKVLTIRLAQITKVISRIIKEGTFRGEFRKIDPDVTAIVFLNIVRAAIVANLLLAQSEKINTEVLNIFFDGLKRRS